MVDINGNSGNSYIAYALCKILGINRPPNGIANIFSPLHVDIEQVNRNYSHALLSLQDHVGPDWNAVDWKRMTHLVESLRIPLIVFSLGIRGVASTPKAIAESICSEAVEFLHALSRKAVSIGVRGHLTAEALDHLGVENYAVVGCPTYFECGPGRRVKKSASIADAARIAAMGLFANKYTSESTFILQSEQTLLHAMYDSGPISKELVVQLMNTHPGYYDYVVQAAQDGRLRFFPDIARWKKFLRGRFDLGAGTRMHGAIMCLNAGIPALVTAGDMRSHEMCGLFGIPHYPGYALYDHTPEELFDMAVMYNVNRRYDALYARFMEWLERCGLPNHRYLAHDLAAWPWSKLEPARKKITADRLHRGIAAFNAT